MRRDKVNLAGAFHHCEMHTQSCILLLLISFFINHTTWAEDMRKSTSRLNILSEFALHTFNGFEDLSSNITVIKSEGIRRAGYVARMGDTRNT